MCEYQSVECAFTSPVSIESGIVVTCRMQYEMSVFTVLQCGDAVSPSGKHAFPTMMCPVLPMCILISCSSVPCVQMAPGMSMTVKVMPSLISVTSPLPARALCAYGGALGYP